MPSCASPVLSDWITVRSRSGRSLLSWSFHASSGDNSNLTNSQYYVRNSNMRVIGWLFLMVSSGYTSLRMHP